MLVICIPDSSNDTCVYPLIQMTPLGIGNDVDITTRLFSCLPEHTLCRLATGYFNLTKGYCNTILKQSSAQYSVLTASPMVSFYTLMHIVVIFLQCVWLVVTTWTENYRINDLLFHFDFAV